MIVGSEMEDLLVYVKSDLTYPLGRPAYPSDQGPPPPQAGRHDLVGLAPIGEFLYVASEQRRLFRMVINSTNPSFVWDAGYNEQLATDGEDRIIDMRALSSGGLVAVIDKDGDVSRVRHFTAEPFSRDSSVSLGDRNVRDMVVLPAGGGDDEIFLCDDTGRVHKVNVTAHT